MGWGCGVWKWEVGAWLPPVLWHNAAMRGYDGVKGKEQQYNGAHGRVVSESFVGLFQGQSSGGRDWEGLGSRSGHTHYHCHTHNRWNSQDQNF